MAAERSIEEVLALLDAQIAHDREKEAFHAQQEELHREQRARFAAELELRRAFGSVRLSAMDEDRPPYSLKAPGSSGSPRHLPGRGSFPDVDDHLVQPEVTRDEIIGGRRVVAFPAKPPHATQQTRLDYVVQAHVAPGYQAATDLLTRHDEESDFATDTCVYKEGADPETGGRYLEEIAFEVVSEQNEGWVTEKARRMHRRGVRRLFTVWVKGQRVCEWSSENQSWRPLDAGSRIEDPCLVAPLAVEALLDAAAADNAVVEALSAKGNPAIRKREAAAEAKGEARVVLRLLRLKFGPLEPEIEERVRCADADRLLGWSERVLTAESLQDVFRD